MALHSHLISCIYIVSNKLRRNVIVGSNANIKIAFCRILQHGRARIITSCDLVHLVLAAMKIGPHSAVQSNVIWCMHSA